VITLDVAANSAENLHSPAIWSYLMMLARPSCWVGRHAERFQDFGTSHQARDR
jgi:hypothetical protein